jgi:hypothetical protein
VTAQEALPCFGSDSLIQPFLTMDERASKSSTASEYKLMHVDLGVALRHRF